MPGERGARNRRAEYQLCKTDIIHWLKYWGWLYNPWNPPETQEFPYIPYEFQEEMIIYIQDAINRCNAPGSIVRENIAIEKCREMAGSWSVYAVFLHQWMFYNRSFLILSRKEEEVDELGNMDTPFEKIRFLLRFQPPFLCPRGFDWKKHSKNGLLQNPLGGSIGGDATAGSAGAGGRVAAVAFDEFAKTLPGVDFAAWRTCSMTAKLRIAISTPDGPNNKFAHLCNGRDEDEAKQTTVISLHWWKDPFKTQNMEFRQGHPWSPWLQQCIDSMDKQTLASEVYINYASSQKGQVYESYSPNHQVTNLEPMRGVDLLGVFDPAVHFFYLICQLDDYGRLLCLKERYWENANIDEVAEEVIQMNNFYFPGFTFDFCGDPAGGVVNTSMHKGKSEYMYLLENYGINVNYDFVRHLPKAEWLTSGIRAVQNKLGRLCSRTGTPMLLVDTKNCPLLDKALGGEYRYAVDIAGNINPRIEPTHPATDAADCVRYALMYKGGFGNNNSSKGNGPRPRRPSPSWRTPSEFRR